MKAQNPNPEISLEQNRLNKFSSQDMIRMQYDSYIQYYRPHDNCQFLKILGFTYLVVDYKTDEIDTAGGDTIGLFGLDSEKICKTPFSNIFDIYIKEQKTFIQHSMKWQLESIAKAPCELKSESYTVNCLMTLTSHNKTQKKLMVFKEPLLKDEYLNPLKMLVIFKDVKHLIKDDVQWCRIAFRNIEKSYTQYMHTKLGVCEGDILSNREKEVLQLINNGYETKEIAEKLYISPVTVNNHRANMLSRTGARDTTALAHIAQMCGIIS